MSAPLNPQWPGPQWGGPPPPPPPKVRRVGISIGIAVLGMVVASVVAGVAVQRDEEPADSIGGAAGSCRATVSPPDEGNDHIDPEALAAASPSIVYPAHPPSSGPHIAAVASAGFFDLTIDPRITTHNLEHGYVVVWYDDGVDRSAVTAIRDWAGAALDGRFPKLIVAQYYRDLPDADVAFTGWQRLMTCSAFDTAAAEAFMDANYDTAGVAPERGIPPHSVGAQGVLDPEGADLLLPPLDEVS